MTSPIDYTSGFDSLPSPTASVVQGLQLGGMFQQQAQAQAQQQAAKAQQEQMNADLAQLSQNPTPEAIGRLSIKYPQLSEQFKRSNDIIAPAAQQKKLDSASQVYAAVLNNEHGIAQNLLSQQALAFRNSGDENSAKAADTMAALVKDHPEYAKTTIGLRLASELGAERFSAAFKNIGADRREDELHPTAVRAAAADAGSKEADNAQKSLAAVGSALGALQGKNAKPEQVQAALKSLAARGLISKDELPDYLASIPTDAKQRDEWLGSMRMAGMKPDDQMKYIAPDANTRANNATSMRNTDANNRTSITVQDRIDKRQEEKGNAEASLDSETLGTMAAQYLAGDKSVMQNLGRGAQGAANIVALRKEITAQAKEQGLSGPQIAAKMADYSGLTAGIRTSAQISARVENAISEAKELAPLAIAASKEVSRSGLLPFGKAGIMFDTQTNNPALKKFVTANNGLVTAYGGAMARGQKPTVSDYEHAREILATAQSQQAYEATVNQMYAEMAAASRAPQNVREHLRNEISGGNKNHAPAPSTAPALPSGWSVKEH